MILILERELGKFSGHHHTQISAIQKLLPEQEVCVITTQSFDLSAQLADYRVLPVLPASKGRAFAEIGGRLGFREPLHLNLARQLKDTILQLNMGPKDRLVVPTCRTDYLRSLIALHTGDGFEYLPPTQI